MDSKTSRALRIWLATLCCGWLLCGVTDAADAPAKSTRAKVPDWNQKQSVVDVFFSNASAELVGTREFGGAGKPVVAKVPSGAGNDAKPDAPEAMATEPGGAWSKIIDAETLEAEVRLYPKPLADEVKSPSQFKGGGAKNCRNYFTSLTFAFAIIGDYDGEVRWKNQALGARELFGRAANNCKVGTDQSYAESKLRVGDLQSMIGGDTLPAPKEIDAKAPWSKFVARAPLMTRLDTAYTEHVKKWTSSDDEFKKNGDACVRESQIMAAIAEVIQREGYKFADDDTYKGFAKDMKKASLAVAEAAKSKNMAGARTAAGNVDKACANCHSGFRS